jgi:hypothetical protein
MAEEGCLRNAQFSTLVCHDNLIVKTINNQPALAPSTQNTATFVSTTAGGSAGAPQVLTTLLSSADPAHNAPLADIKATNAGTTTTNATFLHPFVNIELEGGTSSDGYIHPLLKINDTRTALTTATSSLEVTSLLPVHLGQRGIQLGSTSATASDDITIEMPSKTATAPSSPGGTASGTSGDNLTISAQGASGGALSSGNNSTGGNLILKGGSAGAAGNSDAGKVQIQSDIEVGTGSTQEFKITRPQSVTATTANLTIMGQKAEGGNTDTKVGGNLVMAGGPGNGDGTEGKVLIQSRTIELGFNTNDTYGINKRHMSITRPDPSGGVQPGTTTLFGQSAVSTGLATGSSSATGAGGLLQLHGGNGIDAGRGGAVEITGGSGSSNITGVTAGGGGPVTISGGTSTAAGHGGSVTLSTGGANPAECFISPTTGITLRANTEVTSGHSLTVESLAGVHGIQMIPASLLEGGVTGNTAQGHLNGVPSLPNGANSGDIFVIATSNSTIGQLFIKLPP